MNSRQLIGAALAALVVGAPGRAAAQSVAKRSPNLLGGWVAPRGVIQLNFLHRFSLSPAPLRKITNTPTFNVGTGVADRLMVGFVYGSNSTLVPAYPNEWEFYARALPLDESTGAPVDLTLQAGYNVASESVDGELFVGRGFGPVRLLAAARAFSSAFDSTATRFAVTGGAVVRLTPSISVAGDYGTLLDRTDAEKMVWSAGLQLGVPYTPHSFSIQATDVGTASLEGVSRGDRTRWGFEYTIPITLRRYLPVHTGSADDGAMGNGTGGGRHGPRVGAGGIPTAAQTLRIEASTSSSPAGSLLHRVATTGAASLMGDTVFVDIKSLAYKKDHLDVDVGTTVVWRNMDPVQHSVIADDGSFDSGLVDPGKSFAVTFTAAGVHAYHCMPHPFMRGQISVRGMGRSATGGSAPGQEEDR